jgi:hypothetical protein
VEIQTAKYFMGEVQSVVSSRRFYIGELSEETELQFKISYGLCMDEARSESNINYVMIPDPMLFTETPSSFAKNNFIATKILDSAKDKDMIEKYKQNCLRYRAQHSGLVAPQGNNVR